MSDIFNVMPPPSYEKAAKAIIARKDAEIARLRDLKTPATRQLLNVTKAALESAEAECQELRTALEGVDHLSLVIESAVRRDDHHNNGLNHGLILVALKNIRAALANKEGE